jgi:hypothetical protein
VKFRDGLGLVYLTLWVCWALIISRGGSRGIRCAKSGVLLVVIEKELEEMMRRSLPLIK